MEQRLSRIEEALHQTLEELSPKFHQTTVTNDRRTQIVAPLRTLLERGGKRWRALFMQLTCEIYGGSARALPLTPLVELTHAGSLIIDDIEDGARTRRGGPAAHIEFGMDLAVNAGNLAYFLPTILLETSAPISPPLTAAESLRLYRMYATTMQKLHYGQGLDILWHQRKTILPSISDYFSMSTLKSGSLAGLAMGLGATIAQAEKQLIASLTTIGERFGVSFQIIDDVTNLERGNPGKERGDDLIEGKKSLPLILHGEHSSKGELSDLLSKIQGRQIDEVQTEIDQAISLLEVSGSIQAARDHAIEFYLETRSDLASLIPPGEPSKRLLEAAAALINVRLP